MKSNMRKMQALLLIGLISVLFFSIPTAVATAGIQNVLKSSTVNCIPGSAQTTITLSFDYQRWCCEEEELHWVVTFWEDDLAYDDLMKTYTGTFKSEVEADTTFSHVSITYTFDACCGGGAGIVGDPGDCIEVYATIDVYNGSPYYAIHNLETTIGKICCDDDEICIPEFSTVAIPVATMLGLVYIFSRRKRKE